MDLGLSICAEVLYHLVGVALDDVDVGGNRLVTPVEIPILSRRVQSPDLYTSPALLIVCPQVAIQVGADDKEALLIIEDVGARGVIVRDQWSIGRSPALRRGEVRAG